MAEIRYLGDDDGEATPTPFGRLARTIEELDVVQRRLEIHQEKAPLAVIEWDPQMRVRSWNERAERLFGWSAADVIGRDLGGWRFVVEEDQARANEQLAELLSGRVQSLVTTNRNHTAGGGVVHCEWFNSVVLDRQGEVVSVLSRALDVTEKVRATEALRESEERFKATFEHAPVGIAHHSLQGRFLRINARGCEISGYSAEEMCRLSFVDMTLPDDRTQELILQKDLFAGRIPRYSIEKRCMRKDGGELWIKASVTLQRDVAGRPEYFISVVEDISRQKEMEAERTRLLEAAQQARDEAQALVLRRSTELASTRDQLVQSEKMAAAGQLAAGVGHEINNPLAAVSANLTFLQGQVQLLLNGERPTVCDVEEMRDAMAEAIANAVRIKNVVRDLRTFASAERASSAPTDVAAALEFALSMASHELKPRASVVREFEKVPLVVASNAHLAQVFLHLLLNAAHAIPEGDAPGNRVTARIWHQDGRVSISVSDTGCGIPESILPRIFDPFFTTRPIGEGTGLGLSVCHGIVSALGGEILVQSSPAGTTFTVVVPVDPNHRAPAKTVGPAAPAAKKLRARLLVVDDEPSLLAVLKRLLGRQHEVVTALSGREAIELLEEDADFDLILCDLIMPEKTGMDVFEYLNRRHPQLVERLVMMTAGGFTPRSREFLDTSLVPRLEKPFDPNLLHDHIARSLERKKAAAAK